MPSLFSLSRRWKVEIQRRIDPFRLSRGRMATPKAGRKEGRGGWVLYVPAREGRRQSDEPCKCFKGNIGETSEGQWGAHMGFSECIDVILNWTQLNWSCCCSILSFYDWREWAHSSWHHYSFWVIEFYCCMDVIVMINVPILRKIPCTYPLTFTHLRLNGCPLTWHTKVEKNADFFFFSSLMPIYFSLMLIFFSFIEKLQKIQFFFCQAQF